MFLPLEVSISEQKSVVNKDYIHSIMFSSNTHKHTHTPYKTIRKIAGDGLGKFSVFAMLFK